MTPTHTFRNTRGDTLVSDTGGLFGYTNLTHTEASIS
jgi:hypothetical protein